MVPLTLLPGRRTCSEDTLPSSSNLNPNPAPSSSRSYAAIEFPSGVAPHIISPKAEDVVHLPPGIETGPCQAHCTAASGSSLPESGTSAVEPMDDISHRTPLDRRISLPLLGIDLGRSGPSYGQTLKRVSVAVYGLASDAFDAQDNHAMSGHNNRPIAFPQDIATSYPAHFSLKTTARPSSPYADQFIPQKSDTHTGGLDSNAGVADTHQLDSITALPPSPQSSGTTVQSVFSTRSKSLRSSRPPRLKTERHQSSRNVNLPFKTNIKYPLKGPKLLEEARSHSDSSDVHHNLNTSQLSLDLTSSNPLDQALLSQKNWHKQRLVIKELIETERRYFELLNQINSNYILPIQASQQANDNQKIILSKKTTANIFSNFAAILGLSGQFLASLENLGQHHHLFEEPSSPRSLMTPSVDGCHKRQPLPSLKTSNSGIKKLNIGEILIEFLPFFKLYTTFTSNFSVSQSTLQLHSAKRGPSPAFVTLLADCRRRGVDNGLGLAHMLLGIIQRVPRYELLIKELVKYSTETACDHRQLQSAQTMVGCVARRLEIGMNEQAATKTILTIQRAMEGLAFPLVIPSRKLVKIGHLKKIGRKGDLQDRVFFLFNDCLIYCGILKNGNVESVEKWLGQLAAAFKNSNSTDSLPTGPANVLTIKHISSSFLLPFTHGDDNSPRLIFCRKMDLHDVTTVGAVGGRKSEYSTGFQIISSAKSFVVYANNAEEKENWISSLRETKSELLDSRRTLFIKDEFSQRENDAASTKHTSILDGLPSRGYSWLSLASSEDDSSSSTTGKPAENTPQKSRNKTPSTISFPTRPPNCKSPVNGSVFTKLLSPRSRLYSTPSKSSIFNWKPLVNLSFPPLANQMTQILEGIQEAHAGSLAETISPQAEPTALPPEPKKLSPTKQDDEVDPSRKHVSVKHVAENYCAPVWVPDNHVDRCMGNSCQAWFSVLKRRHHCRLCGGVFCSGCSSRMFVIRNQEHGDLLARACEACFQSVFLGVHDGRSQPSRREDGLYRPILSNRPQDDHDVLLRREKRDHLRHAHRQSLPIDMGSAYFRHSSTLANLAHDDQRHFIVSAGTSVGGDSACGLSTSKGFDDPIIEPSSLNLSSSPQDSRSHTPGAPSCPSPPPSQTHARQRLSSLLHSKSR